MFKLDCVPRAEARAQVKANYDLYPEGMEPAAPFQLYSASPGLQTLMADTLRYFRGHPRLGGPVMAAIRYLAASEIGHPLCVAFNRGVLERMGWAARDIEGLTGDLDQVPLEPGETALLRFAAKVIRHPASITAGDVQACRDAGWTDGDILDAAYNAAYLELADRLLTAFTA